VDLFSTSENENLLPFDGEVSYTPALLSISEAQHFLNTLAHEIDWQQDSIRIFGKTHITKRKVAWYGDRAFVYRYSNTEKVALPWTPTLLMLKQLVEQETGFVFNSCLLNLYHDGTEGMSWHADDEKPLGEQPIIASLSLGATRKFSFKHKSTKQSVSILLENGSLLLMRGETQANWLHALPKMAKVKGVRVNLTFRRIENL
jgi:alkylated DNA repair dioxygenase AlkB